MNSNDTTITTSYLIQQNMDHEQCESLFARSENVTKKKSENLSSFHVSLIYVSENQETNSNPQGPQLNTPHKKSSTVHITEQSRLCLLDEKMQKKDKGK